jgi:DNA-binding phage protein
LSGYTVTFSSAKSALINELISENILCQKGKHHKSIQLRDKEALKIYLSNQLQINDLEGYIHALENKDASRSEFVKIARDSKKSKERAFKGFLVNSYNPIKAELNSQKLVINPVEGSFIFFYDFDTFKISKDITIVGVENSRNFRHIEEQKYLFKDISPLFISRYPQNQNKDFIKWMKSVPNDYIHFGDFDISGIGIYLNEYKKHLFSKAKFFIPKGIEYTIKNNGSRERYDNQKANFDKNKIKERQLLALVNIINTEKKGLDQEYIKITKMNIIIWN